MTRAAVLAEPIDETSSMSPIRRACNRIAPLWPLQDFVAVNPFFGLADQTFEAAGATLRRVAGADLLMPRDYYRERLAAGRITDADLAAALARRQPASHGLATPAAVRAALAVARPAPAGPVPTVAGTADRLRGTDWSRWVVDAISRWVGAYHDQDQALWALPWRDLPLYQAWRQVAIVSRAAEFEGIKGFRAYVARLPEDPEACVDEVLAELDVPASAKADYLHGVLVTVGGWAAYQRYAGWSRELAGEPSDSVLQILAVRLAYEGGMYAACSADVRNAWRDAVAAAAATPPEPSMQADLVMLMAAEIAYQRQMATRIVANNAAARPAAVTRPAVQAAFCIDVRSEVFRRALESVSPRVETIGFAGFFGFAIEFVPFGHDYGAEQCPVLLKPGAVVAESLAGATPAEIEQAAGRRRLRRQVADALRAFKTSAVSCFAYVEAAGLLYVPKLIGNALGLTRPAPAPATEGLAPGAAARLTPSIGTATLGNRTVGFAPEKRLDMAAGVLKAMSMHGNFARLVLLAGHGSTTVNNPHAAGLDCGACGGHPGDPNARVAAAMLNDPDVRAGLPGRGIEVPADTWFVAGLHDTATDDVTLYEIEAIPASHAGDLVQLREWLAQAGKLTRTERSGLLGIAAGADIDAAVRKRSRDWAQVRPEWALANNAAFIAAPRPRTIGLDFGGRSFLHSYEWEQDAGFGVLELIMPAPMVVANWINLQYYGSTVNNQMWGSGNKTLHNVIGSFGVFQGNGGDLKTGLPWQSVHDGERFVHEPLRLSVFIEAPEAQMNRILGKHPNVRQLFDNGWLHLFSIANEGRAIRRYAGDLTWEPLLDAQRLRREQVAAAEVQDAPQNGATRARSRCAATTP